MFYLHEEKEEKKEDLKALEHEGVYFEETINYWREWLSQCTYAGVKINKFNIFVVVARHLGS